MRSCTWIPATLLAVAFAGCAEPNPDDPPPLPVAHCGMGEYAPRPIAHVGAPIAHERLDAWDLEASALDVLITLAGFKQLTPVPYGVKLYRFRYTTQDRGELVEATGMIAIPAHLDAEPAEPWPVALLLHGFAGC